MKLSRLAGGGKLAVTLLLINVLLGLLFAQVQIRYSLADKDGEAGLSMTDLRLYFQGDPTQCRLQEMMYGKMQDKFASADEREEVNDWIADGAPSETYDSDIASIFNERCVSCHGPGGEKASSPLTTYEEVSRFVGSFDTGVSYEHLASVSYIHLVAMVCIAALVGGLFYLTRFTGPWKEILIIVPLIAVFCNILSWWSAKQPGPFLHLMAASVIVYGAAIIAMALLTLVDLWVLLPPSEESGEELD